MDRIVKDWKDLKEGDVFEYDYLYINSYEKFVAIVTGIVTDTTPSVEFDDIYVYSGDKSLMGKDITRNLEGEDIDKNFIFKKYIFTHITPLKYLIENYPEYGI